MKKRILTLCIAFITLTTSVFAATGCTPKEEESAYSDRPITVEFAYYYAGYGDAYYKAIAEDFMKNCNDDIYLKLLPYDDSAVERTNIIAGTQEGDIIQLSVDMFRRQNLLEELSDVYAMSPYGETGTINDKDPTRKEYFTEKYKDKNGNVKEGVFQFPDGQISSGYNFAYNATVLDEIFPDGYTLPRTTEEFFAFGDEMADKGAYLTSAAIKDVGGGDYLSYLPDEWFAQLLGLEGYNAFYKGQYYDTKMGEWTLNDNRSETGLKFLSDNKENIEDAYEILVTLLSEQNDYIHRASPELNYLDNDKVFAGSGYRTMKEKTGFLFIGSWLETELAPLVADGTVGECEYGVMRVPVASSIVKQLDFKGNNTKYAGKMSDEILSAIIEAIDEGKDYEQTKSAVDGISALTEKDFDKIYEARKMVVSSSYANIVVPKIKDESKRAAIYEVLAYFASDRAQKVSAEATGGLGMMPFGKFNDEELETEVSRFVKESNDIANDMIFVDNARVDDIFNVHVTVKWLHFNGRISAYIYSNKPSDVATPSQMYKQTYDYLDSLWDNNISAYKTALGELS